MNASIKKIVHYLKRPKLLVYRFLVQYPSLIKDDESFVRMKWRLAMPYELDLEKPKTFCEKLQWLKLYDHKPEYTKMVDKVSVKEYVASIIGEEYIIPTLGVYENFDDIDFGHLPDSFVLKVAHDSGGVVICKDKKMLDVNKAKQKLTSRQKKNYYVLEREWPYKNVLPRILCEQYIEDNPNSQLSDYKFFCFSGDPKYCQVISDRNSNMTVDFYDMNWNHQPFHEPRNYPFAKEQHEKPLNFETMKQLAKTLSKDIPFVRVDFYNIKGKIYFGEITFYPTSGRGGFTPEEWDGILGDLIPLPNLCHKV